MVLEIARKISITHPDLPIIILTYCNIIFRMGLEKFFSLAKESNVSGVIVPDMTIEESSEYRAIASKYDIDTIFLAAPLTSNERIKKIIECSSGFLYLVSVFGVTGVRERLREKSINLIRRVLTISNGRIPIAVGFGISKPSHIKNIIAQGADEAIVGSKIIKIIEESINNQKEMLLNLKKYVRRLKKATLKTPQL